MGEPREIVADHADDCFGCEHVPGAVHCTTQSGTAHNALMAVQRAHLTVAELHERDAAERAERVERLTRWTAGDWEIARAQEAAAVGDE